MKFDGLNQWLTLMANFGVVAGLILLIVEINQNTEMVRAQINQSRADTAISQQEATYTSDHVPVMLVKVRTGEQLTDEEMIRYETYLRAVNRNQTIISGSTIKGFLEKILPVRSDLQSA